MKTVDPETWKRRIVFGGFAALAVAAIVGQTFSQAVLSHDILSGGPAVAPTAASPAPTDSASPAATKDPFAVTEGQLAGKAAEDMAIALVQTIASVDYLTPPQAVVQTIQGMASESVQRQVYRDLTALDWKRMTSDRYRVFADAVKTESDIDSTGGHVPRKVHVTVVRYVIGPNGRQTELDRQTWGVVVGYGASGWNAVTLSRE